MDEEILNQPYIDNLVSKKLSDPDYSSATEKFMLVKFSGCPPNVKILSSEEINMMEIIHYTSAENIEAISRAKVLTAGNMCYAVAAFGSKTVYPDLTGIFFTTSSFKNSEVGVPHATGKIVFKIKDNLKLLELEPGIFLIPCLPGESIAIDIIDYEMC